MPPQSNPNVLGFSTGLLQTLATSRSKIDSYVTKKKAEIDKNCALHEETIDKEQKEIDDAHKKLTDVQVQRGVSTTPRNSRTGLAHHKEGLMEELKEVEAKTKEVEVTHAEKEKKIKELEKTEAHHRAQADEARDLKERVEEAKQTTVQDLTRGIINYSYLGLDFQKAEGNRLRFTFSHLDAGDCDRTFSFSLKITEDDLYEVDDCEPHLKTGNVLELTRDLNDSDDLCAFVLGMRKAFAETI